MMRIGLFLVSLSVLVTTGGVLARSNKETTSVQASVGLPHTVFGADGDSLLEQLGCGACHGGLSVGADLIRSRAPGLSFAGSRYRPGFLLSYLEDPTSVRPAIGASRMPKFPLDERERLALALYLSSLDAGSEIPTAYPADLTDGRPPRGAEEIGERLVGEFGCLGCHTINGEGGLVSTDLALVGTRLNERWLTEYLATPHRFVPGTPMPEFFFRHDTTTGALTPLVEEPAEKIRSISMYLASLAGREVRRVDRDFERVREANPDVTVAMGSWLYGALNCAGCHGGESLAPALAAPQLASIGDRLQPSWIRGFLTQPQPVRPSGLWPGGGQRMPDFRLTSSEVEAITGVLESLSGSGFAPFTPSTLSPFYTSKALGYVRDRYPCLGCHRLGSEGGGGGQIGPDLSGVGARLTPSYLRAMISDPARAHPGTAMPRMLMPQERVDLLANFLAAQTDEGQVGQYVFLMYERGGAEVAGGSGAQLYQRNCAACHGVSGEGNGFNSRWLPVTPTNHSDSVAMSQRPDDTLFDGIHAGGFILGKSHRMPAYGEMFSSAEIRQIVEYIRTLCGCEQPSWARDNR